MKYRRNGIYYSILEGIAEEGEWINFLHWDANSMVGHKELMLIARQENGSQEGGSTFLLLPPSTSDFVFLSPSRSRVSRALRALDRTGCQYLPMVTSSRSSSGSGMSSGVRGSLLGF